MTTSAHCSKASFSNIRILVVDPNNHLGQIVETILRGFGTRRIVRAATADQGLERLQGGTIDIVITTYMMEVMDGVEFVRLIRREGGSDTRFVPVILLTSHTERYRIERARDAGVTEICAKPVTAQALFRKLVQVVDNPRPFIVSEGFSGPDRRRSRAPYAGQDRRGDAVQGRSMPGFALS